MDFSPAPATSQEGGKLLLPVAAAAQCYRVVYRHSPSDYLTPKHTQREAAKGEGEMRLKYRARCLHLLRPFYLTLLLQLDPLDGVA